MVACRILMSNLGYLRGIDGQGHGVHAERPPRELIQAMDALFRGEAA